jgi:hypothetical protein
MQKVKVFTDSLMLGLESTINNWLEEGNVDVKCISYSTDFVQRYFSAMILYVPSNKALHKAWKESK